MDNAISLKKVPLDKALSSKDAPEIQTKKFPNESYNRKAKNEKVGYVYRTKKYGIFTFLIGNREIIWDHVAYLMKRFKKKHIKIPIIVNEDYQVIDGQHRLLACIQLEKPVYYIKVNGAKLSDVSELNSSTKLWTAQSYLESYRKQSGFEAYEEYNKFKETFGFGHQECQIILGGFKASGSNVSRKFKEGKFEIPDLKKAWKHAEMIQELKAFYPGWRRRSFVLAMLDVFQIKEYNHKTFKKQLVKQPRGLYDCVNKTQYKRLIEEVYNYGLAQNNRIRCY